jgi:hypothetical protein
MKNRKKTGRKPERKGSNLILIVSMSFGNGGFEIIAIK